MTKFHSYISVFAVILIAFSLMLSSLPLHEPLVRPADTDLQVERDHIYCPVCHALYEFDFEGANTSVLHHHNCEITIAFQQHFAAGNSLLQFESRAPPAFV